jgi:hypothetical protein
MSDDPASKDAFRWELRQRLVERLRIPWDSMGDMGNQQRAEAAIQISTMMDEIEAWRRYSQKAERDIADLIRERDEARRRVCDDAIKNGRVYRRVGSDTVRCETPQEVAEVMNWDCFKEKP